MKNSELIAKLNELADALIARGEFSLSYHELQAYNDARMAAQNLQWAEEKKAAAAPATSAA